MFGATQLKHRERVDLDLITHVRIKKGAVPDSKKAEEQMSHIQKKADEQGVASISDLPEGFPETRKLSTPLRGMLHVLRHFAGSRSSGITSGNKGLIEFGAIKK
jgi:hypothetical protein